MAALGRNHAELTRRGATIAAISVDPPGANAAMVEKLQLPFPLLSDPDGSGAIKPYGLWNAVQSIAKPAIVVVAPDGREVYRYTGQDFMDRPDDGDVLQALDQLQLPPVSGAAAPIAHVDPAPGPRAYNVDTLAMYMRAAGSATRALAERMRDATDKAEAERTAAMAERFVKAVAAIRRAAGT